MPLEKQKVPVSFSIGIDTKTDHKQVQGKLLSLQNAIFQTGMEIRKRNGFQILAPLSAGLANASYFDELVSLDGQSLYSYDETNLTQVSKGSLPATSLSLSAVVRNTNQQTIADSAVNTTLECFTYTDSGGGLRYSIIDTPTGQSIVNDQVLDATGSVAKVLAIGTKFIVLYTNAAFELKYRAIDITTPTVLPSAVTINTDVNNNTPVFDATVINGSIFLAYGNSIKIALYSLSSSLVLSSQVLFGLETPSAITIFTDASFNVWVAYARNGDAVTPVNTFIYAFILNNAMNSTLLSKTTVANTGDELAIQNLTATVVSTTATIYFESVQTAISPGVPLNFVRKNTLTFAGVAGTMATFFKSAGLASKVFQYQSTQFVLLSYQSNLQPSYFLVRADGLGVAKLSPSEAGGYTTWNILPEINVTSSGVFQTASLIKDSLTVQNGVISAQTGVVSASFSFVTKAPSKFILGQNLHIAGGMVKMYDGSSVVEHGFNLFPEGVYSTWSSTAPTYGGGVGFLTPPAAVNQKQYSVVYEWTDNEGQLHESAPSIPITVNLSELAAPTVITGDITSSGTPPHNGNTVLNASGGAIGQYMTWIENGAPGRFVNLLITNKVGTTITVGTTFQIAGAAGQHFLLSDYPLSIYSELTVSAGLVVPGFEKNASGQYGQVIQAPPGYTSNYPPDTWYKSDAYSAVTGLFDTNNPPTGLGNTTIYYGIGGYAVPLELPTLKFTDKTNVSIAVYATQVNGTVFFRTSSPTDLIYNDKTVDYIAFSDVTPDETLIGNQELYTTGGVVENIGVPAVTAATTFKSRAIVIPAESELSWWYSKQVLPGLPVEFSDLFVNNIDSRIKKIKATFALDDKLIFFGPTSIFYVVGDGPTSSGLNNTFTDAQLISSDVGCTNQASIVLTPMGIMFQSAKGIYLLDRSLAVQYIGADVEAFNSYDVTSAQLMNSVNQVRFTLSSGTTLVYDYFYKQWDTFIGFTANDSCLFQNQQTYITTGGVIGQELSGSYADGTAVIPFYLLSNWMSFANVQGFQRVYSFLLLGEWKSAHTLTINIYTNFNDTTPSQTVVIPMLTAPDKYQFRVFLTNQKTESVKIEITETQASAGEGLSISNMAFIVGVKTGLYKVDAEKSYG